MGTRLSYWEEFDPIGPYFKDLLGGTRSVYSLGLTISHLSIKAFLCTLTDALGIMGFSSLASVNSALLFHVSVKKLFPLDLLGGWFSEFGHFPHMCALISILVSP